MTDFFGADSFFDLFGLNAYYIDNDDWRQI